MKNEYGESAQQLGPEEWNNRKPETAGPVRSEDQPEDSVRVREWVRQAQSDAERARVHSEQARSDLAELRSDLAIQARRTRGTGWTMVILLIALLGACAYGYYTLHGQGAMLAQFPAVQKSVDGVGQRLSATEDKLRSWAASWDGLSERVGKMEKEVGANLRAAQGFATEQAAKVHHQIQDEMDNRTRSMDAKLGQLESSQREDRLQLASLQQQVSTARSEAATQLASAQQENGREFGSVRSEINQNRDGLDIVARNLDRERTRHFIP